VYIVYTYTPVLMIYNVYIIIIYLFIKMYYNTVKSRLAFIPKNKKLNKDTLRVITVQIKVIIFY